MRIEKTFGCSRSRKKCMHRMKAMHAFFLHANIPRIAFRQHVAAIDAGQT
jgi:hypothetical protein